ncbi:MAG TPA: YbdD/YjiX family protein [Gemmatimonadaceae bacterium]|nr:YbdD/YjiX family protein [Gemmatimonadaceae bacterium]
MTRQTIRSHLAAAARIARSIVGAPDYDRYLAHMRRRHPAQRPLTRDEFARARMEDRYNRPGARCC